MAVTTEQFEALAPIPYAKARPLMRTGDIVLFHSSNLGSDVIEYFTHSLWSHASFVWRIAEVDRVLLLESVDTFGVRTMALSTRINGFGQTPKPYTGKLLLARHTNFPENPDMKLVNEMTKFAIDRLGYPYATKELLEVGARIGAGLIHQKVPGALISQDAFICSEYVARCYSAMGIELTPDPEGFIAPADIANDPNIVPVCAILPDASEPAH